MKRRRLGAIAILAGAAATMLLFVGAFWVIFVLPFAGFIVLTIVFTVMGAGQPNAGKHRGFRAAGTEGGRADGATGGATR